MTYNQLKSDPMFIRHHSASMRGYVSRKADPQVYPYSGRFGEGYKVIMPRWDTTRYVYVVYYVRSTNE